jgi:hypothetical protein
MDIYEESRTLVYSDSLTRRQRSETDWHGWNDYFVALLDNFRKEVHFRVNRTHHSLISIVLLTREETRHNGMVQRHVISRVSQAYHSFSKEIYVYLGYSLYHWNTFE